MEKVKVGGWEERRAIAPSRGLGTALDPPFSGIRPGRLHAWPTARPPTPKLQMVAAASRCGEFMRNSCVAMSLDTDTFSAYLFLFPGN
jgi:hypothetical protein